MSLLNWIALSISFLIVAVMSILFEGLINLIEYAGGRVQSPVLRDGNLVPFVGRYLAIVLRFAEVIILALIGVAAQFFFDWAIGNSLAYLIPILLIFLPISFMILTLCVPKNVRAFFFPKWYEWIVCIICLIIGFGWLIIVLFSTVPA